jgi:hypothetical protein
MCRLAIWLLGTFATVSCHKGVIPAQLPKPPNENVAVLRLRIGELLKLPRSGDYQVVGQLPDSEGELHRSETRWAIRSSSR